MAFDCQEVKGLLTYLLIRVKVNQSTCIAPCLVQTTLKRSGMDHTAFNLQRKPCPPLPRKRSPDGASTECGGEHLVAAHYSFVNPDRMKGWVGLELSVRKVLTCTTVLFNNLILRKYFMMLSFIVEWWSFLGNLRESNQTLIKSNLI